MPEGVLRVFIHIISTHNYICCKYYINVFLCIASSRDTHPHLTLHTIVFTYTTRFCFSSSKDNIIIVCQTSRSLCNTWGMVDTEINRETSVRMMKLYTCIQITQITHDPSYKQLKVQTNQESFFNFQCNNLYKWIVDKKGTV